MPLVMAAKTAADTRSGEGRPTFDDEALGDGGQNGGGHKVGGMEGLYL